MPIKNFRELAQTKERKAALLMLEAALESINTKAVLEEQVSLHGNVLRLKDRRFKLNLFDSIYVVGAGKGSGEMAKHLEKLLGKRITDGIIIDVEKHALKRIKCVKGSHPLPSATNQRAAKLIGKIVHKAGAGALVLCCITGGGSTLLADPFVSIASTQKTVEKLIDSGASIREVNTVRKHLFALAGGNLSARAYPARVVSLIFSDVVGNELSFIASGPTLLDRTRVSDAKKVLKKYKIRAGGLHETPKENYYFGRTNNILLLTNKTAVDAMNEKAQDMGLHPMIISTTIQGEAREVARELVQKAPKQPGQVVIAAGETTVIVQGKGKGGRNQELCAAAMSLIAEEANLALAAMGTDGADNTDMAGAIVDNKSYAAAVAKKLHPAKALDKNDTYTFFSKLKHHHIRTGPTNTNVADVMVLVRGPLKGVKIL